MVAILYQGVLLVFKFLIRFKKILKEITCFFFSEQTSVLDHLKPCPDLVPGHCALALKGMLFRDRGALSFVSICCTYCCHLVTTATSNHRETWVKNMTLMKSCAKKCPCPGTVPEYYLWRECPYPGTVLKFLYWHP